MTRDLASALAGALCAVKSSKQLLRDCAKRDDLRQRRDTVAFRKILTKEGDRLRKYAIETGYDIRTGHMLPSPLEPWACENAPAAMLLYHQVMKAPDGSLRLENFERKDLLHLEYMQAEELITLGPHGSVHMLSDMDTPERSRYPGAPVPDHSAGCKKLGCRPGKCAGAGRQLRDLADGLVIGAVLNLAREQPLAKLPRKQRGLVAVRGMGRGIGLAVRWICREANTIRRRMRSDLDGYRWLSVDKCGRILRKLIAAGVVEVFREARSTRRKRSWYRVPAVLCPAEMAGEVPLRGPPFELAA